MENKKVKGVDMETPNLDRVIDTYVPIEYDESSDSDKLSSYLEILRTVVLPNIRKMQKEGRLRWFSFLIHGTGHLGGREPPDPDKLFIHIRLEPSLEEDLSRFVKRLPKAFLKPRQWYYQGMSGIDKDILTEDDWTTAWRLLGEGSEWVLKLVESHTECLTRKQALQFLHFLTNSLLPFNEFLVIEGEFVGRI